MNFIYFFCLLFFLIVTILMPSNSVKSSEAWSLQYAIWDLYAFLVKTLFVILNIFRTKVVVPPPKHPILLRTAAQLAKEIRDKELLPSEVIGVFIDRMREVNPIINAVCEDNYTEAIELAKRADELIEKANEEEIEKLAKDKPLFGVPYTVKDSLQVKGKKHTCGLWTYKDRRAEENAEVIDRMNASGAILLCNSNVPELCFWVETANAFSGTTCNPYDNRRSAGGSSGGEGALVGSAASVIGIGSDIGGSIRIPSAMNGVFGLKATQGVVPLDRSTVDRMEELEAEFNSIGPLCKYMDDVKIAFRVMGGTTAEKSLSSIDSFPVHNVYIVPDTRMDWVPTVDGEVREAVKKVADFVCSEYAVQPKPLDLSDVRSRIGPLFESKWMEKGEVPHHTDIFASVDGSYTIFSELSKWLLGMSKHSFAGIFTERMLGPRLTRKEVGEYLSILHNLQSKYSSLLSSNSFIILPVWPHVAAFHKQEVCHIHTFYHTGTFNILGLPALACPVGLNKEQLPLSVMIVGPRGSEGRLIEIGYKIEKKYGGWVPPGC